MDTNFTSLKVSNTITGFLRNDGFSFGIDGGASNIARIIQHENWPFYINTHDIRTRVNIDFESNTPVGLSLIPLTRIAIPEDGQNFHPLAILHLGFSNAFGGVSTLGGYRTWMDIGTLNAGNSDQFYVGLIESDTSNNTQFWNDYMDAVINWGDNVNPIDGANNLRFMFTSPLGSFATAGQTYGLEVARLTPTGRMGIGNFASVMEGNGSGILPFRKLEIYDEGMDALLQTSAPQLRLTHSPGLSVNNGIWTDFQTTSSGNLFIHPSTSASGSALNGFVGINTFSPSNTLEINSNSTYAAGTIGNSGLVFTDLRSGNGVSSGNGKVLSVNSSGEVILVGDVGGGNLTGDNSVCTFLANYVPRFYSNTSLGCSQIYDNGSTTVGIGMAAGGNTAFRVHMKGDFLIQPENSTDRGDIYMQDASVGNRRVFAMYGSGGNSTLAIGPGAGGTSGTATRSLYVGNNAGNLTDDETRNTFVGASAGEVWTGSSTTGWNTMIGSAAGVAMTAGNHNTFLGERAGNTFASGDSNTFVGAEAGNGGLTGAARNNILIGNSAVVNATNGTENIVIGVEAQALQTGGTSTNRISIGYKNRVSCNSCFTMASQIGTNFTEQHVGIGTDNPNTTVPAYGLGAGGISKLYVTGWNNGGSPANIISAYFAGDIYSTASFVPSDLILKDNIQPFTDASAIIDQLEAKSYNFKHNDFPTMNLPSGNQIGFLADDVAAVAPQLVHGFSNPAKLDAAGNVEVPQVDFVGVNYAGLIPILFTAIKQQKAMLDSLALVVSNCCNNPQPLINNNDNPLNKSSLALTNNETIILNQNAPNPFEDKTEISYNIPESVKEAQILFYDQSGKVLHKFEISHRGQGSLTVFSEYLSSGMYSYTLIIDGKNHQTKRMMKQ